MVVDLTDKVMLRTAIAQENHAALRSGFAGYPPNPRWNAIKFRAWKMGRQLREARQRCVQWRAGAVQRWYSHP